MSAPFLDVFLADHKYIQDHIFIAEQALESGLSEHFFETLEELLHFLSESHHPLEENVLFKRLATKSRILEGGPMCGLYFDMFRMNPVLRKMEPALLELAKSEKFPMDGVVNKNHPLSIPLTEHRAIELMLEALLKTNEMVFKDYKTEFKKMSELLQLHIQKERECLFVMAGALLNSDEKIEITNLCRRN